MPPMFKPPDDDNIVPVKKGIVAKLEEFKVTPSMLMAIVSIVILIIILIIVSCFYVDKIKANVLVFAGFTTDSNVAIGVSIVLPLIFAVIAVIVALYDFKSLSMMSVIAVVAQFILLLFALFCIMFNFVYLSCCLFVISALTAVAHFIGEHKSIMVGAACGALSGVSIILAIVGFIYKV